MNKKNILILLVILLALVVMIVHFGFHDKILGKTIKLSNSKDIKKEMQLCFSKKNGENKRVILIAKDKDESETAGGDIFIKGEKIESSYVFKGFRKNDILDTYGEENKILKERIYKIYKKGIMEGFVEDNNIKKTIIDGKESWGIKDLTKITFNEKLIIPKISCDNVEK